MLKIVTVTGPSCAGKTTLVRALLNTGHFTEVVSFTTRDPRAGEREGVDYYFKSREMVKVLEEKGLIAECTEFKGNFYGILKHEIETRLQSGKLPLVIVEAHGLEQIQCMYPEEVYSIYLDASIELLYERFLERFVEDLLSTTLTEVDTKYYAKRLSGIQEEASTWLLKCQRDFYIDHFTEDNKDSIISSLVKVLLKEKSNRDQGGDAA
jgi:guanylate kinase